MSIQILNVLMKKMNQKNMELRSIFNSRSHNNTFSQVELMNSHGIRQEIHGSSELLIHQVLVKLKVLKRINKSKMTSYHLSLNTSSTGFIHYFFKNFRYLNAICVVLKSSKSFPFIKYSILTQIPQNLQNNVIFCFSNSEVALFKPRSIEMELAHIGTECSNIGFSRVWYVTNWLIFFHHAKLNTDSYFFIDVSEFGSSNNLFN